MGSGASSGDRSVDVKSFLEALLGETLLASTGVVETDKAFTGKKQVGLYFAAERYPRCKTFTPKLKRVYEIVKDKGLEIVFCSSDKKHELFEEFRQEMPWLALPFESKDKVMALKQKFKVTALPRFVLVDAETGELITEDGRSSVERDPKGEKFPWKIPSFEEALPSQFHKGQETVGKEFIEGKTVGLLFSGGWTRQGVDLASRLANWYAGVKADVGDKFEIIYCGCDTDELMMTDFYKKQQEEGGTWLAVPMSEQGLLDQCFGIRKVPAFVIVDAKGQIINKNAKCIPDLPAKASDFPFPPPPIGLLSSSDEILKPAMCLMLENCEEELQNKIIQTMNPIAEKYVKAGELLFFAARRVSPVSATFRTMANLPQADEVTRQEEDFDSDRGDEEDDESAALAAESADVPSLILVDLATSGEIYAGRMSPEMNGEGVENMIKLWKSGELHTMMKKKKTRRFAMVCHFYQEDARLKLDMVIMNTIISAAARAGDLRLANQVLRQALQLGLRPSTVTFGALISAALRADDLKEAESWLESCREEGLQPGAPMMTPFISYAARQKDLAMAESWFHRMLAERISPDVVTYGSMISVANKLGQADAADGWLQRAIKEKVAPNKICFGMVISALATASSIDAATQRLDDMVGNGFPAEAREVNAVLKACARASSSRAGAAKILDRIVSWRVHPDTMTKKYLERSMGADALERVPLAHGKFLTNGLGGTVPVSKEARAQRAKAANFPGFMGEEFGYLWEREDGYLGNAGFIYGVLLTDPDLQVDMLQHPVSQADRQTVRANHPEMADALDLEAAALKAGVSQSYAASIAGLVNGGQYQVILCASKGIGQLLLALPSFAFPLPLVLLNGAEPPAPMDVGKTPGFGPDFAELGRQCVGHPKVPRLVLTSHGSEASGAVRRAAMSGVDGEGEREPLVALVFDISGVLADRFWQASPLGDTCWRHLPSTKRDPHDQLLESIPSFPGPVRFAQLLLEQMDLTPGSRFRAVTLKRSQSSQRDMCPPRLDENVYDILFDAQAHQMQVVLKHVKTGDQTPISKILAAEGQYATRRIRFFRYYQERSSQLNSLEGAEEGDPRIQWAQHMIHELLAMNKNLGNFLWTGFMTPATAQPRFGSDLLELILEVELARLGGAYRGYSRGHLDAEHRLQGQYSLLGNSLDAFLARRAEELREQRLLEFNMTNRDERELQQFLEGEAEYFKSHSVKELDGYVRRELTIDHNIPWEEVQQKIQESLHDLGTEDHFRNAGSFGHSSNFRFFVDGKVWLSAGCEEADFAFIQDFVTENLRQRSRKLSFIATHVDLENGRYQELPKDLIPPQFFERNGYQVLAYRKLGDAQRAFLGQNPWERFHNVDESDQTTEIWVPGFGLAEPKSKIFGHFKELPLGEIGRGGTTAQLYLYDTKLRARSTPGEVALWTAVQVNQASWWEPQLYMITPDLQSGDESLIFSSQEEFFQLLLRTIFEQELLSARNLWLTGIKKDGVRKASRSFPQMGGREGELEELMGALAKANVVLQEKQAGNRFSMRPTNAKRVWSTGHFSVECREDLCRLLLDLELLRSTSTPAISKQQAVMLMNRTLRYCPALALEQIRPWREAFRALLGDLIEELRSLSPKLRQEELGDLTPLLQRFRQRLALGVERHNTFTDLQKEVNAILSFLPSRT
ncbi:Nucleoredoxin [Durusdinium trenchii]|uniref:Nucleoredoxin n=1 Tax=Durusdinium trenchii TaxID=1381693 RepID=A0ABP0IWP1_9DINO